MTKSHTGYSLLLVFATMYLLVIFRYQTMPKLVVFATVIYAFVYLIWGVVHHLQTKSFHAKIVLEYFLVALLGVAIVATLLV